jgi:hypothetical protein
MILKFLRALLLVVLTTGSLFAQIEIHTPQNRAVFQRNLQNQAHINISGSFTGTLDDIQIRFLSLPSNNVVVDWQTIVDNPHSGYFSTDFVLSGGWYRMELRGLLEGQIIQTGTLDKVGVGEVFVIAGQSNTGSGNFYDTFRSYGLYQATDDRVNTVDFAEIDAVDNANPDNNFNYPEISFKKIDNGNIGPRGTTPWCWGILGDSLVKRLGVPVLFMNTGWAGTSVRNWSESATTGTTQSDFGGFYNPNTPYGHLRKSLNYYTSYLGVRSVIWIQGEADNYSGQIAYNTAPGTMTAPEYASRLQTLIDKSRTDLGKNIPWLISRTSLAPQGYTCNAPQVPSQRVIDGQNMVIGTPNNLTFAGPSTDDIQNPRQVLGSCVHFTGEGFITLANAFNNVINTNFLQNATPVEGHSPRIHVETICATSQKVLTVLGNYAFYSWSNGSTDQSITVGSGQYSCTVGDALGNTYQLTASVVTEDLPVVNITATNTVLGCANPVSSITANGSSGILSWTGPNNFTSGQTTIVVRKPGTYQVVLTQPNGCTSSASMVITSGAFPVIPVAQGNTSILEGASLSLSATNCNGTLIWYNASSNLSVTMPVSPQVTTDYFAKCAVTNDGLTCSSDASNVVKVTVIPGIMSVKTGNWEEPSTWNLGRLPTINEDVIIDNNHIITVNTFNQATARRVIYRANTNILMGNGAARLTLGIGF